MIVDRCIKLDPEERYSDEELLSVLNTYLEKECETVMQEKSTDELDAQLRNTTPDCMDKYYKENRYYIAETSKAFTYYMKDVIDKKNLAFCHSKLYYKDIYSFAGVSESYGEKILNMEKHTKNRDLIIRFCVAGRFQLNEINTALKLYGMKPLYAKDKRDACIIVAINNRKYDLGDIDDMLVKNGLLKLSADG